MIEAVSRESSGSLGAKSKAAWKVKFPNLYTEFVVGGSAVRSKVQNMRYTADSR
jgi:hypothetical protein